MAKVETATLEEARREEANRPSRGMARGLEFLVGQIFAILATVVGVYLAGYVGFQRNLEYDRYQKAQQKSDLLTATREELKQNVERLRKFDERLPAEVGTGVVDSEWPHLRLFVWQATGRSSSAFDLPPQILNPLEAFYDDVDQMLNSKDAHENFRSLTQSNIYDRTKFKERFEGELKAAESLILPALESEIASAGQLISKYSDAN
jgi:cell division protein FtsB